jgi:hypothetical protein
VPRVKIQGGVELEVPNRDEIREDFSSVWEQQQRARVRGIKWMRLPETLTGKVVSNAITLGVATGQTPLGPESGYAWTFTRLMVTGLATGATPDVVNLYRNDRFAGPPLWQFNGNNFGYTFGKLRVTLMAGDTLSLQNVGALAATGTIFLSGELIEVPAERLGELA